MAGTPKPIGRILIIPKGNYDPATPYNSLDLVRYDFKSWLCKTDGIIGITPTEGTDWTLMTEDGTDGTDGRGIVNIQRTGTDPSNPLKDIYTITYTDGTTSTFTVTNGSGGGTTADTMLKSVYDKDDDGIVDKADAANTATNATDATNAKNLKKSDGTTISADSINNEYTFLGQGGKDEIIPIPTNWRELYVIVAENVSEIKYGNAIVISRKAVDKGITNFGGGHYVNNNNKIGYSVYCDDNTTYLEFFYQRDAEVNTCGIRVFYK